MEGSKIITTEIGIQEILLRMKDHAYYIGESAKADPRFVEISAKIQASDDDDPILKDYISDATSIVCDLMSRMIGETTYEKDDSTISFIRRAKTNTPEYIDEQLKDYIINYMSTYILRNWLNVIKADEAQRFNDMLARLENEIIQLAARRTKPERS